MVVSRARTRITVRRRSCLDGGTEVTESWQVLENYDGFLTKLVPGMDVAQYLDGVKPVTQQGMAETLANLKSVAESS